MTVSIVLQFMVVLAAIWMGARSSGIGLGLWGAVGLMVLVGAFGITPTSPPVDVMLIILAVIMAASVMEAAGGIDFLVGIAERIIRANPKYVTIVAPLLVQLCRQIINQIHRFTASHARKHITLGDLKGAYQ